MVRWIAGFVAGASLWGVAGAFAQDCNGNGTADSAEISGDASLDRNGNSVLDECEPFIDVWYGETQTFGAIGKPQIWVNVLGTVSDADGVASLTYRLNGRPARSLRMGADERRLYGDGDFNVEIGYTELNSGANQLVITATDELGNSQQKEVTINYVPEQVWPGTYSVNFATVSALSNGRPNINSVAQVVDGLWRKTDEGIRPATMAYNRVVAIGDETWEDYEVTVGLRLHAFDPAGFNEISSAPGFGMQFRWRGNTDRPNLCTQPRCGWQPSGAGLWYNFGTNELSLGGALGDSDFFVPDPLGRTLNLGSSYFFKAKVETVSGGTSYSAKIWPEGQTEPSDWQFGGVSDDNDPPSGSFYLIAHHADITFRTVSVRPLTNGSSGGGGGGGAPGGDFCYFFDDDFDGVNNCQDECPVHADKTSPGVCGCERDDVDTDEDGVLDCNDGCPDDPERTSPGPCGCGTPGDDADGDGVNDCLDGCPDDPEKTAPGMCGCGVPDLDEDENGQPDCTSPCEDGSRNDADGDGTVDCLDLCPADAAKVVPGLCGCGASEADSDGDASPDCVDECPADPTKSTAGSCGCGVPEDDADGDGTPDCNDRCPDDPNKATPGACGCGEPETDANDNDVPDCIDQAEPRPGAAGCGAGGCGAAGTVNFTLLGLGFAQWKLRRGRRIDRRAA